MQPLKKEKKRKSITDSQQLWGIYFTYLYIRFFFFVNCAFVRVWPKTHTKRKNFETQGGGGGGGGGGGEERKKKVKNKSSEVIGLHATEVKK